MRCWTLPVVGLLLGASIAVTQAAEPGITDKEVTIGMWTPLSGANALQGTSARDSVEIGIAEINAAGGINGRKLKLIAYDDSGSPQSALAAVRRLIDQDNVFALISGSTSGATLPVLPLINRAKIPFIASISSNRKLLNPFSRYVFRVYANEVVQAERVVDFALKRGVKKPGMIYNSNDYGIGGHAAVTKEFKKSGVSLVASERYNQADQDFSAQLLRIKESGADAMFLWALASESGIIVRQARELGLAIPIYSGGGVATPLFPKAAGPAGVGVIASYVVKELPDRSTAKPVADYRAALTARYSGKLPPGRPSEYDLAGYGAIRIFAEGLRRAGKDPTRESFIAGLETLTNFDPGTLFPVTYNATKHEATEETSMLRDGKDMAWEIVR